MYKAEIYGARAKEQKIVSCSSSGGLFTIFSESIIKSGGAVACVIYDYERHVAKYELLTDTEQLGLARGSKYMQAQMNNIYHKCESWIKQHDQNQKLIFFGMGCQAEAFRRYAKLKNIIERVYIIDIICHGVPSPKVWKDYISKLEVEAKQKITYLTFKDKRNGWKYPYAYAQAGEKEISVGLYIDIYNNGYTVRPSCFKCRFARVDRKIDLTIGDYWGVDSIKPDFYSPQGNSLLIVHTERGKELFRRVQSALQIIRCEVEECLQPSLIKPRENLKKYNQFWIEYNAENVVEVMEKYSKPSIIEQFRRLMRKYKNFILNR